MKLLFYIIIICTYTYFTEVSYHGMWAVLDEIQEPELKNLARKLPKILLHSRADATSKNTLELLVDGSSGH